MLVKLDWIAESSLLTSSNNGAVYMRENNKLLLPLNANRPICTSSFKPKVARRFLDKDNSKP